MPAIGGPLVGAIGTEIRARLTREPSTVTPRPPALRPRAIDTATLDWEPQIAFVTPSVQRLAVPESAVLPTGERSLVFVDLGDGRLAPREVLLGTRAEGYIEVRSGLQAGEIVVTSGNFLVAAESKLRSAAQKW